MTSSNTYKYKSPEEKGAVRIYISKKDHNKILPNMRVLWSDRYEYYRFDNRIEMHRFTSNLALALGVILLPISVLFYGIKALKEDIPRELKRAFNEKEYGAFVSDVIWDNEPPEYDDLCDASRRLP